MIRSSLWLALLLPAIVGANIVSPSIVSPGPDAVSVTIYRASEQGNPDLVDPDAEAQGIALVSEARELELPTGESTIEFVGVAGTIVPQSARLDSLPGVIAESNFDYKLISPGELISNSVGQMVRLVRTDGKTGKVTEQRAKLVSGPEGVLLDVNGKIEALDCSGEHEKLVFDSVPGNLRSKPVLSAKVRVNQAGHYVVRLSYLAMGFDWSANYVARIQPDGRTLELTGWITLANKQDTGFVDAPVQVIAGNIERDPETQAVEVENRNVESECWPIGSFYSQGGEMITARFRKGVPAPLAVLSNMRSMSVGDELEEIVVAKQRDLGDYKLYELPYKTALAPQQVKQVMMGDYRQVPFEKIYTYTLDPDSMDSDDDLEESPAHILVRMINTEARGLGKPLPAGNVVVMEPNGTQLLLSGMNTIKDVAVGLPVDVELSATSSVRVKRQSLRDYHAWDGTEKYDYQDMEVTLINGLGEQVRFELKQEVDNGNISIFKESMRHIMLKGLPAWALKIPPRSSRVIRYTLRSPD